MSIPPPTAIPAWLAARDQWVAWRLSHDPKDPGRKAKKIPVCPHTGRNASSTNDETWGSLDEALACATTRRLAGVGAVVVRENGETWIDADGCLIDGEVAEWWAAWHTALLDVAYAEVSPSGTGIKYWTRATIESSLVRKFADGTGVEVYSEGRYFTVTGNRCDGCQDAPQPAQDVVDALLAHFAPPPEEPKSRGPEREREAPRAEPATGWRVARQRAVDAQLARWVERKIATARSQMANAVPGELHHRRVQLGKLLGGVIAVAPHLLSPEAAEAILFGARPPATHSRQELEAIRDGLRYGDAAAFTGEDLPRDLWTDEDLVIRAGRACCPRCGTPVKGSRYQYAPEVDDDRGWYCPRCTGPMKWPTAAWTGPALVDALVVPVTADGDQAAAARDLPLLLRASDLGKLPPAVPLIPEILFVNKLHVLFGAPGAGKSFVAFDLAATISQIYPVVYVAAEAVEDFEDRREAWEALHGVACPNLWFWRQSVKFANPADVERLIAAIGPLRPALVIIDPIANCMSGLVEGTQEGMMVAIDAMEQIRMATGAGVLALHHTGWDGARERGSSTLRGAARVVIGLERAEDGTLKFTCVKKNQGAPFATRYLRLVLAGERGSVVPLPASRVVQDTKRVPEKLYLIFEGLTKEALSDGATHAQITDYTGYPKSTTTNLLDAAVRGGYVAVRPKGNTRVYTLTDEGRIKLERHLEPAAPADSRTPTPQAGRFTWEVCGPDVTGLDAVGAIDPKEPPTQGPSSYTAPEGYDEPEPEPDEAPSPAQAMVARFRAMHGGPHAAD